MDKEKIRKFFYSSSKIATGIFIASLFLGLIVVGYVYWENNQEAKKERELAKKIEWPDKSIEHLNIDALLSTKWSNGSIRYILRLTNYSNIMEAIKDSDNPRFSIYFYDRDGFELNVITLQLNDFSRKIDVEGNPSALTTNNSEGMLRSDYQKIEKWAIGWNI